VSRLLAPRLQRLRFTLFAPFYDAVVRLDGARRRSLELLALGPGERVLLLGAGTGADLPLLPDGVQALVTDITPAMLDRARRRARPGHELAVMDAMALDLPDASFDAAVLHLILALVPDPGRALAEASRAVRPGGRIVVLDKGLAPGQEASPLRRAASFVTRLVASDINLRLGTLIAESGAPVTVVHDEVVGFGGLLRATLLARH